MASFDINVIPVSALERVEILKDGASSIYGSDAIGGVINYITRKGDREIFDCQQEYVFNEPSLQTPRRCDRSQDRPL